MSVTEELWGILLGPVYQTIRAHIGELGLTRAQGRVLHLLGFNQHISQVRIARTLGYDPSTVSALTDSLESQGLVERKVYPADKRVRAIALTDTGRVLRATLDANLHGGSRSVSRLTAEEQALLRDLLLKAFGSQIRGHLAGSHAEGEHTERRRSRQAEAS